jgi:hypothetical protein
MLTTPSLSVFCLSASTASPHRALTTSCGDGPPDFRLFDGLGLTVVAAVVAEAAVDGGSSSSSDEDAGSLVGMFFLAVSLVAHRDFICSNFDFVSIWILLTSAISLITIMPVVISITSVIMPVTSRVGFCALHEGLLSLLGLCQVFTVFI